MNDGALPDSKEIPVRLRLLAQDDYPLLYAWTAGLSHLDLVIWSGMSFDWPLTLTQIERYGEESITASDRRSYMIEIEAQEGAGIWSPAGFCELGRIDRRHGSGRLGKVLIAHPHLRGRGIGTAALRALVSIGFDQEQLHKLTLGVFDFNARAVSCYRRLGFQRDGLLRDHYLVDGSYLNLIEMSLLRSEWQISQVLPARQLETPRLILRSMTEADAPRALEFYRENREFHADWSPLRGEEFYTLEGQLRVIREEIRMEQERQGMRLWIYRKDDSSRPLGNIGFSQIIRGHFCSSFIGYQMDHEEVRKGYISEALAEVLRIGFTELGLHRIEANIMPGNAASIATVTKFGFRPEGVARNYLRIAGQWEDHVHYVLLREDWEQAEP